MPRWDRTVNDDVDTEIAMYRALEKLRWPQGAICPFCHSLRTHFISAANGKTRKTGLSVNGSVRRIWKCGACRRQFSVLIGTPLSGTHLPLSVWFAAITILARDPYIPIRDLADQVQVNPRTAFKLRRKIQQEFL